MQIGKKYDVVIIGAGLAGLSLCRHLLLQGFDKSILLLDNRADLPGSKQKYGESLVQVGGYYFTRVLDLEEHLLREHYAKYNLRFHWKSPGRDNRDLDDYGRSFIGKISNVATYHLNRNKIEAHLLDLFRQNPNVTLCAPVTALNPELSETGAHTIRFGLNGEPMEIQAGWVVDTTGRTQMIKRKLNLKMESPIAHGSSWCWVEGLVNVEKLTTAPPAEIRMKRDMQKQGLLPIWLATNHFCGEGFWFWVIPLKGLTSLGVVYDKAVFPEDRVTTPEKLIEWVCEEFPLFRQDLPGRKILDSARLASYSYDSKQTLSASRWAMSGMSGRFSDPLYSPGSDLIAYYNTFIVDAILEEDAAKLQRKAELYEALMKVVYDAYVPSYSISYDTLGDQEIFTFKYAWELAIYFSFYAFPFINDLFTHEHFVRTFFRKFAQLGPINRNLQRFLSDYYQWKKRHPAVHDPVAKDFTDLTPLKKAEMTYYKIASAEQAEELLDNHLQNMKDFARYIYAYIASVVVGDKKLLMNREFVSGIKLGSFAFDAEAIQRSWEKAMSSPELYEWNLDPEAMEAFRTTAVTETAQSH